MTTFSQILEARSKTPEAHVIIVPTAFADDWLTRPQENLALGLRRVSDSDIGVARAEAAKYAIEMHDDVEGRVSAFNDALMRWLIVRGTCDPNDIFHNAPIFEGSEENVRNALTSQGIRFVWDHVERFHIEKSPLVPEATPEEFNELVFYLKMPTLLDALKPGEQKRFKKLVGFLLEQMRAANPQPTEEVTNG